MAVEVIGTSAGIIGLGLVTLSRFHPVRQLMLQGTALAVSTLALAFFPQIYDAFKDDLDWANLLQGFRFAPLILPALVGYATTGVVQNIRFILLGLCLQRVCVAPLDAKEKELIEDFARAVKEKNTAKILKLFESPFIPVAEPLVSAAIIAAFDSKPFNFANTKTLIDLQEGNKAGNYERLAGKVISRDEAEIVYRYFRAYQKPSDDMLSLLLQYPKIDPDDTYLEKHQEMLFIHDEHTDTFAKYPEKVLPALKKLEPNEVRLAILFKIDLEAAHEKLLEMSPKDAPELDHYLSIARMVPEDALLNSDHVNENQQEFIETLQCIITDRDRIKEIMEKSIPSLDQLQERSKIVVQEWLANNKK